MRPLRIGWSVARGLAREAVGVAQLAARYPTGIRHLPMPDPRRDRETFGLPVLCLHGYFHNRSGFYAMSRALRRRGFTWVHEMNYNPLRRTIPSLADELSDHVEGMLKVSGAPAVHVVGHSLGGLIARWFVQEMDGACAVDHCVTIGTPHSGTLAAYVGLGPTARQMRPGSDVLHALAASLGDCTTKFVNVYSDMDVLMLPAVSAKLRSSPTVENHLVRGLGHGSLLMDHRLISTVVEHLATSRVAAPMAEVRTLPRRVPPTGAADASR